MIEKNYELRELFYTNLSRGVLTAFVNEDWRCTGKTTLLIEASLERDMPIIVKHKNFARYIKDIDENVRVYTINNFLLDGLDFNNGVLVDEGLEMDDLRKLKRAGIGIKGGFIYI